MSARATRWGLSRRRRMQSPRLAADRLVEEVRTGAEGRARHRARVPSRTTLLGELGS